jgi:hypothetical protein
MDKNTKLRLGKNIICLVLITCLISILLATIVSCKISSVHGSGNVISENRAVSGFSRVSISGSGNLFIEQGDEESLTIEAEDNILPIITTKVSGNTLNIGFKLGTNVSTIKSIEFHLQVKDLDSISTSGSGNVDCSGLSTSNLIIKTSGSGDIDISNLITTSIDINSSGSGNYTLAGETDSLNLSFSGSGACNAGDLKSKECKIKATGSGDFIVNISDDLNVSINGSGDVSYIGNPTVDFSLGLGASGEIKNISE